MPGSGALQGTPADASPPIENKKFIPCRRPQDPQQVVRLRSPRVAASAGTKTFGIIDIINRHLQKKIAKDRIFCQRFSVKRFFFIFAAVFILMAYVTIAKRLTDKRLATSPPTATLHVPPSARAATANALTVDDLRGPPEVVGDFDAPMGPIIPQISVERVLFKAITMVIILGALAGGIIYLRKHNGRAKKVAKISVSATLALGAKHHLAIAECEGRRYLIGIAPQTISYIDVLEPAGAPKNAFTGDKKS
jgi:flagellar biogenesis protein FliO